MLSTNRCACVRVVLCCVVLCVRMCVRACVWCACACMRVRAYVCNVCVRVMCVCVQCVCDMCVICVCDMCGHAATETAPILSQYDRVHKLMYAHLA